MSDFDRFIRGPIRGGDEAEAVLMWRAEYAFARDAMCGWTALHWAYRYTGGDREGVVRVLLDRGCDIEAEDRDGWRPLHRCVLYDNRDAMRVLLDRGCDIEAEDGDGWRPLHLCAFYDKRGAMRVLLEAGCCLTALTPRGETPLEIAQRMNNHECASVLRAAAQMIPGQTKSKPIPFSGLFLPPPPRFKKNVSSSTSATYPPPGDNLTRNNAKFPTPSTDDRLNQFNGASGPVAGLTGRYSPSSQTMTGGDNIIPGACKGASSASIQGAKPSIKSSAAINDPITVHERTYPVIGGPRGQIAEGDVVEAVRMLEGESASVRLICTICEDEPKNCALNCGHVLCMTCAEKTIDCFVCRRRITNRTKLFL